MPMRRDQFLQTLAAGFAMGCGITYAQSPAPAAMHLLIPANPGGGWDLTARALGQALMDSGQASQIDYENRGGAAGTIGLAQFASAHRGDASALMVMGSVLLGGIITGKPPTGLDQVKPLARLTNEYNVFVLPPQSPYDSMQDVLRQFRRDPRSIRWGGGSRGSTEHIAVHMLARALGVAANRINYVPFRGGGEAASAVMAGYVSVGGSGLSEFLPHIAQGRMRAVAVTADKLLPAVHAPTLKSLGVDVVIGNWRGVCAAPGLSEQTYDDLKNRVRAALSSDTWQRALRQHQWISEPLIGAPFEAYVQEEFERMRSVLNRAGLG